jgi:hypothetical protein
MLNAEKSVVKKNMSLKKRACVILRAIPLQNAHRAFLCAEFAIC